MSQFKEGQRVIVIGSKQGFNDSSVGKHGVICVIDNSNLPVLVKFDDGGSDWGCLNEIVPEMSTEDAMINLSKAALVLSRAKEEYNQALEIVKHIA